VKQKVKVCLIGATAVGKSSLVGRFVHSVFSDQYRTTIGVKIETRTLERSSGGLELVVWDLSGEDEFQNVQTSYLRGAGGCLLVVDGTRTETLDVARTLEARERGALGPVPFVVVVNKADLVAAWEIPPAEVDAMRRVGWPVVLASAKTGAGVEEAFGLLADAVLQVRPWI
jgi:small GTP-binding protein